MTTICNFPNDVVDLVPFISMNLTVCLKKRNVENIRDSAVKQTNP